ncbi:PE-PGRS family protein PE_PGRS47-like [Oryza brachyantha]|uniref:PE-PGRS family protein PE_PGRS47-like n=1 Tax=Oryza brachyantha TaxID=4533 RepID=UPI001AD9A254|nr:PE-PGRS family protein PE_PGRS47-like [Oryza brachyantha]
MYPEHPTSELPEPDIELVYHAASVANSTAHPADIKGVQGSVLEASQAACEGVTELDQLHAMASFKLRHVCLTVVILSIVVSSCRGQGGGAGGAAIVPGTQDAVQIVAQAALCFDNRQVINGCLQSMGINVTGGAATTNTSASAPAPAPAAVGNGSTAAICSAPCFGQMNMMMGCVNGIFSNFVGYSPGLMQGVQAVFQMSCGNVNGQGGAGGASGGATGGGATGGGGTGSTSVSSTSGSHVAVERPGYSASGAAGPTVSLTSMLSSLLIVWAGPMLVA